MQPVVIAMDEEGTLTFLVNDESTPLLTDGSTVKRASHVEPVSGVLRVAFHGLRSIFGEKGWMSDFTRAWPCLWRVNLAPTGGPILPQTYRDRQAAIDAEIGYLNANFI